PRIRYGSRVPGQGYDTDVTRRVSPVGRGGPGSRCGTGGGLRWLVARASSTGCAGQRGRWPRVRARGRRATVLAAEVLRPRTYGSEVHGLECARRFEV